MKWILAAALALGAGSCASAPRDEYRAYNPDGTYSTFLFQRDDFPVREQDRQECERTGSDVCNDYALGLDLHERSAEALEVYRRECARGNLASCIGEGAFRQRQGDFRAALPLFQRACAGKSALGCVRVGKLYREVRSAAHAHAAFARACGLKYAEGCAELGYAEADAGNKVRAQELFLRACKDGSGIGCAGLGAVFAAEHARLVSQACAERTDARACRVSAEAAQKESTRQIDLIAACVYGDAEICPRTPIASDPVLRELVVRSLDDECRVRGFAAACTRLWSLQLQARDQEGSRRARTLVCSRPDIRCEPAPPASGSLELPLPFPWAPSPEAGVRRLVRWP
jgi:hypothetical protein